MKNKLEDNEQLEKCVYSIIMNGNRFSYNPDDFAVDLAIMYGFIKVTDSSLEISNHIFETRLYNYFLTSEQIQKTPIFRAGTYDKSQFTENGFECDTKW